MFVLAFVSMAAYAQSLTITGKVVDSEGYELIGSSVTIKGAVGVGTVTDINGNYTLKVKDASKDVLIFSYVGMTSQEVKVNNQSVINVTLKADAVMLDEVVAIGYATVKRKDLTGSVASVGGQELSKIPVSDVTQALSGRMAGVMVQQSEGAPGSTVSIRVRGGISITQSNEPLYVIDGFPSEDGMASLDPAEIETIDVLKDASATAIYGARGANGVVVISTKNGSKSHGKATVTFDSYVGFKTLAKKLDVLSPYEFVRLDYERTLWRMSTGDAGADGMTSWEKRYGKYSDIEANYANRPGINWQDEALGRTALTQNYRVAVSGKTEKMNYSLAYSFYNEEGAMVYSGTKKHNISFNMNHEVNKWLTVNSRISYDQRRVEGMGTSGDSDRFNKMQHILQYRPTIGIQGTDAELLAGEDPILADDSGNVMQNPLISAAEEINDREWRTFQANGGATIKLLKGLSFRSTVGMLYQTRRNDVFYGAESQTAKRSSIKGTITNLENNSFQTSNVLTYAWNNKIHDITAMVGHEFISKWARSFSAGATQFPNDEIGLGDLSLGTPSTPTSSENYDDKLLSFFARVNYSLLDKYLFTASVRADGSSKFAKDNRWGYFPSGSLAWTFSRESFVSGNLPWLSNGKLRASWGLTGNNRIGNYDYMAQLITHSDYYKYPWDSSFTTGYVLSSMANPSLKWETTEQFDLGIDLGFLKGRINLTLDYYIKTTKDLLLNAEVPASSGYATATLNIGKLRNKGFEITLESTNITTKDFTWSSNFNIAFNNNEIIALNSGQKEMLSYVRWDNAYNNMPAYISRVGESAGKLYGYIYEGTYKYDDFNQTTNSDGSISYKLKDGIPRISDSVQPGDPRYKKLSNDGTNKITDDDRTIIGNGQPKHTGGFTNNFVYKNWDLNIFLQWSYGNDILNANRMVFENPSNRTNTNMFASYNNRWSAANPTSDMPRAQALDAKHYSSLYVEDGSFLKLKTISLGYNLGRKALYKLGIQAARVYFSAENIATLSGYSGSDPEVSVRNSVLTPGFDWSSCPRSFNASFGVNITF